jgi:hypothetical protein
MPTIYSGLADQVSEAISTAVQHVREIFADERLAYTATDSISKPPRDYVFDII